MWDKNQSFSVLQASMRNKVGEGSGTPKQLAKKIKLWKNYKENAPVVIKIAAFLEIKIKALVFFGLVCETK